MTFADVMNKLEPEYGRINFRERLMLRKAFDIMLKDGTEEAVLQYDIDFENEKQRDDYDLSCSCGALYHFEDENEVNSFVESNFYCSVCGRKWRIKL